MQLAETIFGLIALSLAVASIAWTVTQEEIFSEIKEYCAGRSKKASNILERKFFYVFTCEYCFSHWVTFLLLIVTGFHLMYDDWRGLLIAFFVTTWLANQWMSLYRRLRVEIKHENALAEKVEEKPKKKAASA